MTSPRLALAAILLATCGWANAEPSLHPLNSDHAVLQRGKPIRISGFAAPGERVSVSFATRRADVVASQGGDWMVTFPALDRGGPFRIEARSAGSAPAIAEDVVIGDVWLCSGQSNMEWAVSQSLNPQSELPASADPLLRLVTIAKRTALTPATSFAEPPKWLRADPTSVAPFSAACYFMARDLRKSEGVPIGLINASWGGTAIRPWMDAQAAAAAAPGDAALLALYERDRAAGAAAFGRQWQEWWLARQSVRPWADPSALSWEPMKVGYWEQWGDPKLAAFNGMVWARSSVTLTAEEAAQPATLSLGVIDEIEQSWVNGVPVGHTFGWDVARNYELPRGLLRAGENSIVVNIVDAYAAGGFQGPESVLALRLANGTVKPLAPKLEYSIAPAGLGDPPRPPWDSAAGLSLIYNAMIAPLGSLQLKGVAWYQGETDAGMAAGYSERLSAMIGGWRKQFRSPELPFLIVGLPGWGPPHVEPTVSGWAEVRDAQRRVAAADRHAALVPAIDIGDRLELHPPQKQEVGRRLAEAARALAYGASHHASGPQAAGATRAGADVLVTFAGATGALRGWSGAPVGFELCAATQDSCRFARATVEAAGVRVHGDGRAVTRVRYAWADAPVANLFDEVPLPVSSFELPVR